MAQYKFEGDIKNINKFQLEFINKVIQEQGLQVKKVVFHPVGQAGDGFVANVKRINIDGENGSLKMIVKVASEFEAVRKMTHTEHLFSNEHTMYTEVLPKLVQLQKDAGVPKEEHLRFAKCYGSLSEAPNEVILLEDLNELGFTMLDKFESLSDDCVKSILKNFAILHSLSFVLKNKEPENYDFIKNKLTDMWAMMAEDQEMMAHVGVFVTELPAIFDNETHKSLIRNVVPEAFKLAVYFSENIDNKYSVIIQGDAWTNNIMFRNEGDLVQSIMIDYQASRNYSPVIDLLFMIFNCTDHETRSKYYYNWLDYYYSKLENCLSNFDLKANFVYPREQFKTDLKKYGILLFGLSVMLANLLTRDSNEASKFMEARQNNDIGDVVESMKMEAMPHRTMNRFKKRVLGLVDSFTEFELL